MRLLKKTNSSVQHYRFEYVYKGEKKSFEMIHDKIVIGRNPSCDIQIDDTSVSDFHALIYKDKSGNIWIRDLESTNGVVVNRRSVKATSLTLGSQIKLGEALIFPRINESPSELADSERTREIEVSEAKKEAVSFEDDNIEWRTHKFISQSKKIDNLFASINKENVSQEELFLNEDRKINAPYTIDRPFLRVIVVYGLHIIRIEDLELKGNVNFTRKKPKFSQEGIYFAEFPVEKHQVLKKDGSDYRLYAPEGFKILKKDSFGQEVTANDGALININDKYELQNGALKIYLKRYNQSEKLNLPPIWGSEKTSSAMFGGSVLFTALLALLFGVFGEDILKEDKKKEERVIVMKVKPKPIMKKKPVKKRMAASGAAPKSPNKKMPKKPRKVAKARKAAPSKPKKVAPKLDFFKNSFAALTGKSSFKKSAGKPSKNFKATKSSSSSKDIGFKTGNLAAGFKGGKALGSGLGSSGLGKSKGFGKISVDAQTVVMGSIDPEKIRELLRKNLPQFRHCYQREINKNKDVGGVVDITFTIGSNGRSKKTVFNNDSGFTRAGKGCMGRVLAKIQFPKPKGGGKVDVRQPFNFYQ